MDICVASGVQLLHIKLLCTSIAQDLCGHVFLFVLGKYLEVDLLGCNINSCVTFQETAQVLQSDYPFYIPTSNTWGFHFLHLFTNSCYCLFYYSHPNGYGKVFHCSSNLHFLVQMTNVIKHLFKCVLTISLVRYLFKSFTSFFSVVLLLNFKGYSYIMNNIFIKYMIGRFSQSVACVFIVLVSFEAHKKS